VRKEASKSTPPCAAGHNKSPQISKKPIDARLLDEIKAQVSYWQRASDALPNDEETKHHFLFLQKLLASLKALRKAGLLHLSTEEVDWLLRVAYGLPVSDAESRRFGRRVCQSGMKTAECAHCSRFFSLLDARNFAELPCHHYLCPECFQTLASTTELAHHGCPTCSRARPSKPRKAK